MSTERADLGFSDAMKGFDPSEWTPRPKQAVPPEEKAAARETSARAAEAAGFTSREPKPANDGRRKAAGKVGKASPRASAPAMEGQGRAEPAPRRRRTGRNAQFNLKARPETIDAYCAIADRMGWGLGETLERAVELLEREHGSA